MEKKISETNKATLLIKEALFKKGVYAWRNSVGMLKTEHGIYQMGKVGSSDLMAVLPPTGRFLGIEIKKGKDKLRPEQIGFIKNIQAMGGGGNNRRGADSRGNCTQL